MSNLLCSKLFLAFTAHVALCDAARILGIAPIESPSHNIIMSTLFKELARRGHNMTVITVMPLKEIPLNYTQIPVISTCDITGEFQNLYDLGNLNTLLLMDYLWYLGNKISEMILKNSNVQTLLHSPNENFDLIVQESFYNAALLGFSHKFNAPFVSVTTFSGTEDIRDAVGDTFPYAYVPNPFIKFSDHMTFFQRIHNTIINFITKMGHHLYFLPAHDAIMRKYFNDLPNLPPLVDIVRNTSILLLNTHVSHGYPKPKVPNLIEVGGMHIKPPQKLPEDIQKILDSAENGVIYFSMGSNLKSSDMSAPKREAFLNAFVNLKQKILWKFEENLPGIPENVKISKWYPQSDILGHPNLRAFMTHGGLLSSQEAVYNAVPLVGIPINSDQALNIFRAVETGYALQLDFNNITEASVYWMLSEVVNNPNYKMAAKRVSRIFHDQLETPMERAVFWIEHVLRHNGAKHMRSAALDLTWCQYYLLDVVTVLAASLAMALLSLVLLFRTLTTPLLWLLKRPRNTTCNTN